MKLTTLLSFAVVFSLAAGSAFAGDVTVKSVGYHNQKGKAIVYLWKTGADGFPKKVENSSVHKTVEITPAGVTVTFSDVAPGSYAVTVTHDENENGKMDYLLGTKPKEGYGASNNPQNAMSAPTFEQCKFDVTAAAKAIDITMRY